MRVKKKGDSGKERSMSFCCASAHVVDDYVTGDSICTGCGLVIHRDHSLQTNASSTSETHHSMVLFPPDMESVYRVVNELELEPPFEWYQAVSYMLQEMKKRATIVHICGALTLLLRERRLSEVPLVEYVTHRYGVATVARMRKFVESSMSFSRSTAAVDDEDANTSLYTGVIHKLSGVVALPFANKTGLIHKCMEVTTLHPTLQFKLPASVVVAVLFKHERELYTVANLKRVCACMEIKPISVKKIMAMI